MNFSYLPIKLIFFTLLLWPISRVWLRFQEAKVRFGSFLFWTGIWVGGVFVIFKPDFLSYLANLVGIGRGSDFAIYLALITLFYLVFRANIAIEDLRYEISKLVREIALLGKKNNSKKS
jgi:hypothetical protein